MCTCGILIESRAANKPISWSKFAKPNIDKVKNVALKKLVLSRCPALTKFYWRAIVRRSDRVAFVNSAGEVLADNWVAVNKQVNVLYRSKISCNAGR